MPTEKPDDDDDPGAVKYNGPAITPDDPTRSAGGRLVGDEAEAAALLRLLQGDEPDTPRSPADPGKV